MSAVMVGSPAREFAIDTAGKPVEPMVRHSRPQDVDAGKPDAQVREHAVVKGSFG